MEQKPTKNNITDTTNKTSAKKMTYSYVMDPVSEMPREKREYLNKKLVSVTYFEHDGKTPACKLCFPNGTEDHGKMNWEDITGVKEVHLYQNGKLHSTSRYLNNTVMTQATYDHNERILNATYYLNGKKHVTLGYQNDELRYQNNELYSLTQYDEQERPQIMYEYVDGSNRKFTYKHCYSYDKGVKTKTLYDANGNKLHTVYYNEKDVVVRTVWEPVTKDTPARVQSHAGAANFVKAQHTR